MSKSTTLAAREARMEAAHAELMATREVVLGLRGSDAAAGIKELDKLLGNQTVALASITGVIALLSVKARESGDAHGAKMLAPAGAHRSRSLVGRLRTFCARRAAVIKTQA